MKRVVYIIIFLLNIFSVTYARSELKGVWVASIYNLNYPTVPTTDTSKLKSEVISILDNVENMGLNAIFLQVRPSCDALYNSSIFPWSKYLTGKNGTAPNNNFDPLKYWIEEAHKRGIEVHAWINPYRITKKGDEEYNLISEKSPAKIYSNYVVKYSDGNYYFNPGIPEVRTLIVNGALEIVNNYDVDGIHLDDYFYPGVNFDDDATYKKYGGDFTNIEDWRRNNVDLLVKELNEKLHKANKNISFGISPFGIWANSNKNSLGSNTSGTESYYSYYADTRKWAKEGLVDYIAPQIYWERGNSAADYTTLLNWWSDVVKGTDTKLYIGLADYKSVDVKSDSVWYNGKEIEAQMNMNSSNDMVSGEIHYNYSSIMSNTALNNLLKSKYKNEIAVFVNNKKIEFDEKPTIENNRTLVPLRAIFEALGANVTYSNGTVTAKKANIKVSIEIGNNIMYVNDESKKLDVPAKIINGRTFVPLRAISEAFGNEVKWDGVKKVINIR